MRSSGSNHRSNARAPRHLRELLPSIDGALRGGTMKLRRELWRLHGIVRRQRHRNEETPLIVVSINYTDGGRRENE